MEKVTLDRQEIMRAVTAYMALKGYRVGEEFTFENGYLLSGISFNATPKIYDFKSIVHFANRD